LAFLTVHKERLGGATASPESLKPEWVRNTERLKKDPFETLQENHYIGAKPDFDKAQRKFDEIMAKSQK
jgi:hypothetical protein